MNILLRHSKSQNSDTVSYVGLENAFNVGKTVCQSCLAKRRRRAPLALYMSAQLTTLAARIGHAMTEPQKQSLARLLARRGIALGHLKRYIFLMACTYLARCELNIIAVVTTTIVIAVTSILKVKQWEPDFHLIVQCGILLT